MNFGMIMLNQNMVKMQNFVAVGVEKRFGTSSYELDIPLPKEKK